MENMDGLWLLALALGALCLRRLVQEIAAYPRPPFLLWLVGLLTAVSIPLTFIGLPGSAGGLWAVWLLRTAACLYFLRHLLYPLEVAREWLQQEEASTPPETENSGGDKPPPP